MFGAKIDHKMFFKKKRSVLSATFNIFHDKKRMAVRSLWKNSVFFKKQSIHLDFVSYKIIECTAPIVVIYDLLYFIALTIVTASCHQM